MNHTITYRRDPRWHLLTKNSRIPVGTNYYHLSSKGTSRATISAYIRYKDSKHFYPDRVSKNRLVQSRESISPDMGAGGEVIVKYTKKKY
jgi:hypothetical protein